MLILDYLPQLSSLGNTEGYPQENLLNQVTVTKNKTNKKSFISNPSKVRTYPPQGICQCMRCQQNRLSTGSFNPTIIDIPNYITTHFFPLLLMGQMRSYKQFLRLQRALSYKDLPNGIKRFLTNLNFIEVFLIWDEMHGVIQTGHLPTLEPSFSQFCSKTT